MIADILADTALKAKRYKEISKSINVFEHDVIDERPPFDSVVLKWKVLHFGRNRDYAKLMKDNWEKQGFPYIWQWAAKKLTVRKVSDLGYETVDSEGSVDSEDSDDDSEPSLGRAARDEAARRMFHPLPKSVIAHDNLTAATTAL